MAKVKVKNKKSLQSAKSKTCGVVSFREMKNGRVIAAKSKWSVKAERKKSKKK